MKNITSTTGAVWKDADGKTLTDEGLYQWVKSSVKNMNSEYELIVGVDSHRHKKFFQFITVVCVYRKGRGGYYFYKKSVRPASEYKGPYPVRVRTRMFYEASLALETAQNIFDHTEALPVIHLDASPPGGTEVTSAFSDQLSGYIVGSGFECVLKPWAFVASGIADKHSKSSCWVIPNTLDIGNPREKGKNTIAKEIRK